MDLCKVEPSDRTTWGNCTKLDLYSKNVYNPLVKVTDWEKYSESQPTDVNPYCTSAFDLHYSHYNQLGGDVTPVNYTTTTREQLEQILTRDKGLEVNPNKVLNNLFTEIHQTSDVKQTVCSSPYGADFVTTMQHSFQPPYPYLLKRLSRAKPPYFLHRYLRGKDSCKFLDDDYVQHTQRLQLYKNSKHISFNPCTGYYTDGTLGDERDIY